MLGPVRRPHWGIWAVPERELRILPDVEGKDVVELGCGTAYWSAWLARAGARPVGVDISERQLENALSLQREFGLEFPLLRASAEEVPLPDATFDLVLSEYGASVWCDPHRWIPEAARLLRSGGRLVMMTTSVLLMLCSGDDEKVGEHLVWSQFGMLRFEWPELGDEVEFHLPHGEMIRLLDSSGLAVEDLVELQAPEGGSSGQWDFVSLEWARRWPSEEIWRARKR